MIRRPPRSTLFPYNDALPICQLVTGWNQTRADYERGACLHELFARQAARTPDAVAVGDESGQVTYAELDRRTKRLRSAEHPSELQSRQYLVCRLLLEKKNQRRIRPDGGELLGDLFTQPLHQEVVPRRTGAWNAALRRCPSTRGTTAWAKAGWT